MSLHPLTSVDEATVALSPLNGQSVFHRVLKATKPASTAWLSQNLIP